MWIHLPPSAFPSAQAWEASSWDSSLPSETLTAASLTANGKLLQPASLQRAWQTAPWMKALSGMILSPSQADSFAIGWLSSRPEFLVSPTASPENEPDSRMSAGSGPMSSVPFAIYDPDTCSWKTSQASLPLEGLTPSLATFPPQGMTRNGIAFPRRKRAPRTAASGGSVWPTVTAGHSARNRTSGRQPGSNHHDGETLSDAIWLWQTPDTDSFRSPGGDRKDEMGLDQQARFWATPRAEHDSGRPRGTADTLHSQVKSQWPTPNASNGTGVGSHGTGGDNLQTVASTHLRGTTAPDGPSSSPPTQASSRRLNPRFAEMLMAWPPGYTNPCTPLETSAFAPLGMAWSHLQLPSRGLSSSDDWRMAGD